MKKFTTLIFALFAVLCASAEIRLPSIISSGMVLQRQSDAKIWGWTAPNTKVEVKPSWLEQSTTTKSDDKGRWIVTLATPAASLAESVVIESAGEKVELLDVAIGDVWICSGQSNMVMSFNGTPQGQYTAEATDALLEASSYPNIRLFGVGRNSKPTPQEDFKPLKKWCVATSDNVVDFSSVAYFFGRTISRVVTDVPIALIQVAWGGSMIEAWMPNDAISALGDGVDVSFAKSTKQSHRQIAKLYNGMIAPITNFAAKGFLWYQGESNKENISSYDKLLVAMVESWRKAWGSENMPFYAVEIVPYDYPDGDKILPLLVEAQTKAIARIPNSGLAGTNDLGNPATIHPALKRQVGERLAFLALRSDYGHKEFPIPAPTYKSMEIAEGKISLTLNNVGKQPNGISVYKDQGKRELLGFEIAGEDRVFHKAECSLAKNNKLVVSSDKVKNPVAVRYSFSNIPTGNIKTGFGMPLVPFRTDDWEIKLKSK